MGGAVQIAMHAFGKMTLFMCAGAIYVATKKTNISQMRGLGRVMPFTFGAFFIGALSIIGLPPLGGTWTKFYLMIGAADAGQIAFIFVLMASSLLNVAYLLPPVVRAFYSPRPADEAAGGPDANGDVSGVRWGALKEAPLLCVAPPCFTAVGAVVLFFFAEPLTQFLAPILASGE
ncbi:MAG: proton-conducting transporter membrane subunit, partial [Pseudomonadota bacterium]